LRSEAKHPVGKDVEGCRLRSEAEHPVGKDKAKPNNTKPNLFPRTPGFQCRQRNYMNLILIFLSIYTIYFVISWSHAIKK
jgi:hypothetical protein